MENAEFLSACPQYRKPFRYNACVVDHRKQQFHTWIVRETQKNNMNDHNHSDIRTYILALIAASPQGLSEKEIIDLVKGKKIRPQDLDTILNALTPLVSKRGDFYMVGTDKARSLIEKAFPARKDIQEIHSDLASFFLGLGITSQRMLAKAAFHFCKSGRWDKVVGLLTDFDYIAAKCRAGMLDDLIGEYRMALHELPEAPERKAENANDMERLRFYIKGLIAFAAFHTAPLMQNRPENASEPPQADKSSEPAFPEKIISIIPWNKETYEENVNRIAHHPTRLHRLIAFQTFIHHEEERLVKFADCGDFCLQHAFNFMRLGPVASKADKVIRQRQDAVLLLRHPQQRTLDYFFPSQQAVLKAHEGAVNSVDITPDGTRALSGGDDGVVMLWDPGEGISLMALKGHSERITAVRMTPDARCAVTAAEDRTLRFWDLHGGNCLRVLEGHTEVITAVDMTPDGALAISSSMDKTLRLWNLKTGELLTILSGHEAGLTAVCMTADGCRAVSAGGEGDGTLCIWNLHSGECLRCREVDEGWINGMAITPDGFWIVTVSNDDTLRLWHMGTGLCVDCKQGYSTVNRRDVDITVDGRRIALPDLDRSIQMMNRQTLKPERYFKSQPATINSLRMTADGRRMICGGADGVLRLLNTESGYGHIRICHLFSVESLALYPDGSHMLSASSDNCLMNWNLDDASCYGGHPDQEPNSHEDSIFAVCITPDGERAVSGGLDDRIKVWDPLSFVELNGWETKSDVEDISPSVEGKRALVAHADATVRLWDIGSGYCQRVFKGHDHVVSAVAAVADGRLAVSASCDCTLKLWDLQSGRCLKTMKGHDQVVHSVRLSADGRTACSASSDATVRLWDLKTGDCRRVIEVGSWVNDAAITADGSFILSAELEGYVKVWDFRTGECLAIYPAQDEVNCLSEITVAGHFGCGLESGEVLLFRAQFPAAMPHATPVRLWRYTSGDSQGEWDDAITIHCPWCRKRFRADVSLLQKIAAIQQRYGLKAEMSPCLELPDQAWKEPGLTISCKGCDHTLRSNPYVVDLTQFQA
ncbi:hypothetical protein GF407_02240 [candidate division KSB1 bacterium]|nr:hypothetical protein [candidate division KSB1 bacterium]